MVTRVMILDLGLSEQFEATMDYARALIRSTQAGAPTALDVEYVRTTNRLAISTALLSDVSVLHVMGHGVGKLRPAIVSEFDDRYRLSDQAAFSQFVGVWPAASCLIMDACNTWGLGWHQAIRRCVPRGQELLYVGTTKSVTWAEATLFTGNFYASAQRAGLVGDVNQDWELLETACRSASAAYKAVDPRGAPFKWKWLVGTANSGEPGDW